MVKQQYDEIAARKHVTERCLIAADVDKTILTQTSYGERSRFLRHVAPQLLEAAELGMKLAFVTGNSMSQLSDRFLKWLLEQLCHTDDLELLQQFHFFCNSGGVYFRFPITDKDIATALNDNVSEQSAISRKIYQMLTCHEDGTTFVHPRFIDSRYLARTKIPDDEVDEIRNILDRCGRDYYTKVTRGKSSLGKNYDISKVMKEGKLEKPFVDIRPVKYGNETDLHEATVQLTLKPILSFLHGISDQYQERLFENDLRTKVINHIQGDLDANNLGHYVARPGGLSSIDVTLEKLDKAYAMEFLIDSLNLQGSTRKGQRFGTNAIYFGDEVIVGGGNDYPVTRIPGLLVFAVNPDKKLVPFLSHVFVPSSILEGPEATKDVLSQLNKIASNCLKSWIPMKSTSKDYQPHTSAIDCFKVKVFGDRIHSKIDYLKRSAKLNPEEWQILHAFVTLMHRDDPAARRWLAILIDELDAIMTQVTENPRVVQKGIGTSHPDN